MTCKHCCAEVKSGEICEYCGCLCEPEKPEPSARSRRNIIINIGSGSDADRRSSDSLYEGAESLKSKNKGLAIVLCSFGFFGAAGIHRFYLGKYVSGILYFCTAGFCYIGTIVDLLLLITGSMKDANGQKLV